MPQRRSECCEKRKFYAFAGNKTPVLWEFIQNKSYYSISSKMCVWHSSIPYLPMNYLEVGNIMQITHTTLATEGSSRRCDALVGWSASSVCPWENGYSRVMFARCPMEQFPNTLCENYGAILTFDKKNAGRSEWCNSWKSVLGSGCWIYILQDHQTAARKNQTWILKEFSTKHYTTETHKLALLQDCTQDAI
jgi:hypothetical protein